MSDYLIEFIGIGTLTISIAGGMGWIYWNLYRKQEDENVHH